MHVTELHKVKLGYILWRNVLHCPALDLHLGKPPLKEGQNTNNSALLQLQLRSAGSLHAAFRNLRESQSLVEQS